MNDTAPTPPTAATAEADNLPTRLVPLLGRAERTRPLPSGAVACRSCGRAVAHPAPRAVELLLPTFTDSGPAGVQPLRRAVEVRVTRCAECSERLALAESLVEQHGLGRWLGNVAAIRLDTALAALDLLGIRGTRTASLTRTAAACLALIEALAGPGAVASWERRFVPVLDPGADPASCAPSRWGAVGKVVTSTAGVALAELVRRRSEVPGPVAPPTAEAGDLRGCLACGVGHLTATPSDAAAAWGPHRRADPGALGGRGDRDLTGYLCPRCRRSVGSDGIGRAGIERALLAFLGYQARGTFEVALPTVRAWAVMRPGTRPNATPWAHLDLDAMRGGLVRSPYVRRVAA